MARFDRGPLAGLILALAGACSPAPIPAPAVIAPYPQQYSCVQLKQMGTEYAALPPGAMLGVAIDDYRVERAQLKALHRIPDQRCP